MEVLHSSEEANLRSETITKENGAASGNTTEGFDGYAQVNGVSNGHKEHKSDKKDKHRDRDREKEKQRDKDKYRDKDKERSKHSSSSSKDKHSSSSSSRDKERSDKDKERSDKDRGERKDKSEHKSSSSSKDKERDRDKDKSYSSSSKDKSDRDKDKYKSSSSSSHKSSSKDKEREKTSSSGKDGEHRSKDRDKERSKEKERSDKDKERNRDKDKERSKEKDRDKERSRDKDRDKERSKEKDRDKERSKDRHKDHDKERSKDKSKGDKSYRDKDKPREKDKEKDKGDVKPIKQERLSSDFQIKEEPESPVKNHQFEAGESCLAIKQEKSSCDLDDSSFTKPDDMTFGKDEGVSTEDDEGYHDTSRTVKQDGAESDDECSLVGRLNKSSSVKRKIESEDEDDDVPLVARSSKKVKKEVQKKKKRKASEDEEEEEEEDFKAVKKPKKAKPVKTEVPSPRKKKKEEEQQEVWKWWEEEKKEDGVKWNFLEHKGPLFAPLYEPLPPSVKFYYDGKEMRLSEPAEEVATFYAKMLEHDYTTKDVFNKNFFKDWRKTMADSERATITDLSKCNFKPMNKYFLEQTEIRKAMSKEEKKAIKEKNDEIQKEMGFCKIDGHTEKIGNFRIEPPGLFRGRGEHPKMGMLKKRVEPEDVIINCSQGSKVPVAPAGHRWKEVRHDNKVTWLASWTENVQGQVKYVMLNPSSKLKGEKDWQKYETARKLAKCIDKIRADYRADWKSKEMRIRQRAVAMYFIDKLALRAGNEKDEDQADTVGCCSLRVEHIELHEEKDGKEFVVVFDFLGKDSIRYYNEVPVEKRVFKNLQIFMENKKPGDDLFDRLNTGVLNKHLSDLMEGLTAKVFRTYNASWTLQQQLNELTNGDDNIAEKILSYNRANRAVAILCNHQRSVPKSHDKSMENLKGKIEAKREQVKEAEKAYKDLKRAKGHSVQEKVLAEKKRKALEKLREQLNKLEIQETDREENKTIALGTSKLNYLDPRISVAWCKKHDVPIEKIYNKTQRDKFRWAIDMAGPDYVF